jgi:TIR domain-containing protein
VKIFVSWSGNQSREMAEHLNVWIEDTFDTTDVWYSTTDITVGEEWGSAIREQLAKSHIGILCLTEENKGRPWMLFEAGAISKQVGKAHVLPLLIGLETELQLPLSMFQAARATQDGVKGLFWAINEINKSKKLSQRMFDVVFKNSWKRHGKKFLDIVKNHEAQKHEPEPI